MQKTTKAKILQYCGWLGIIGIIFYFLHVIVGNTLYSGYSPIKQAISDLTADGAPSKFVAGILTDFYGVFLIVFSAAFYIFFRKKINLFFSLGAIFLFIMNVVSVVGFKLFPLSKAGYANTFQDRMHLVTTVIVVVLSIISLIMFAIGFIKNKKYKLLGYIAIITLFLMMTGSVLSGAVPAILGLAERLSIYSLHIYILLLAIFMLRFKEEGKNIPIENAKGKNEQV